MQGEERKEEDRYGGEAGKKYLIEAMKDRPTFLFPELNTDVQDGLSLNLAVLQEAKYRRIQ